jgi:hypothetical protein
MSAYKRTRATGSLPLLQPHRFAYKEQQQARLLLPEKRPDRRFGTAFSNVRALSGGAQIV